MSDGGYNGWKNRQTWNVALWVNNDEGLYSLAVDYATGGGRLSWDGFVRFAGLEGRRTGDGIAWQGRQLDRARLSEMLREMRDEAVA